MAKKKIVVKEKPEVTDAGAAGSVGETSPGDSAATEPDMAIVETSSDVEAAEKQPDDAPAEAEPMQEAGGNPETSPLGPSSPVRDTVAAAKPASHRRRYQVAAIAVMAILVTVGIYLLLKPNNPLPKADTKLAKFTVYYPHSNGSGYTYVPGSASFTAGQLTYSLEPKNTRVGAGGPIIRITEQALSGQGPNLSALTNFTLMKVPAGHAAIGNNGTIINGVIVTKKTLIILNGLDGAPRTALTQIMKSM